MSRTAPGELLAESSPMSLDTGTGHRHWTRASLTRLPGHLTGITPSPREISPADTDLSELISSAVRPYISPGDARASNRICPVRGNRRTTTLIVMRLPRPAPLTAWESRRGRCRRRKECPANAPRHPVGRIAASERWATLSDGAIRRLAGTGRNAENPIPR